MNQLPIARIPRHWAEQYGAEANALVHESARISWGELDAASNRLARAYSELGVKHDDFVTIALPNGIEFFVAAFAVWKLGATPQPVSARLPKFERDQIIEVGSPTLVVGVPDGSHPGFATVPVGFDADRYDASPLPVMPVAASFKAMTSGGSTGRPKLIVSKTSAIFDIDSDFLGFDSGGSVLIPGPLYHNGPFMWGMIALFRGNRVTVTTRFDAEQSLAIIDQEKVDTVYFVPTMMHRIWNLPEAVRRRYDLSSLKRLWHLAAPCPQWLKEAYIGWLGAEVIWELYGGTEGQGTTIITGTEWLLHRGSVGKPLATCEMKAVDEQGNTLPPDSIGEIFIRPLTGQGSTYRYIGAEARAIEGGWESLGDMGYFDADGYLYLTDRLTDMILSGGANIYPAEIEGAIEAFPGVRSCAVIGLPNDDLGNTVHAIVDVPEGRVSESALIAHLNERMVRYKIPRTFEFVSEPLRDDAGKVRRKQLRAERLG